MMSYNERLNMIVGIYLAAYVLVRIFMFLLNVINFFFC